MELREKARAVKRELEKVRGVAKVVPKGLPEREIHIAANLDKMNLYRLSLVEIADALAQHNQTLPGGVMDAISESPEKFVRTVGEFQSTAEIANTVIRSNDLGQPIRVRDVAEVSERLERQSVLHRTNGKPSIALTVLKKENADVINMVDAVYSKMADLKELIGPEIDVSYINDFSTYVRRRLNVLLGNLAIGLILVLLVLPVLIPFKYAALIGLGIPIALMGCLTLLYTFGISINLLTMMGLIIVCGILVDDAIVVTENSVRLMEEGADPQDAAIEGTLQVAAPVTASVLTTVFAFLPMCFMSGIFGKFVKHIPYAVITALLVSLVEAFLLLPSHLSNWLGGKATKPNFVDRAMSGFRRSFETKWTVAYGKLVGRIIRFRYMAMGFILFLLVGTGLLASQGMRFVLFPPDGVEIFFIRTEAPIGTSLQQHEASVVHLESLVASLAKEEVQDFTTTLGIVQQDPNDPATVRGAEFSQITVYLTPENDRERTATEIIEELRIQADALKQNGGPLVDRLTRISFQRVNPGPPQGKPISLEVRAENYDDMLPVVDRLKQHLSQMNGVSDVLDNYRLGKEEVHVVVNDSETRAAGLSVGKVGTAVRGVYEGLVATTMKRLDEEIDIRVSLPDSDRTSQEALDQILIPNAQGNLIPLREISQLKSHRGVAVHEHQANSRQIRVTGEVDVFQTSALEVNSRIRSLLPELKKEFPHVQVEFGGEDEDTRESFESLIRAFLVAILLIFLMLVLTFQSLLQPLLVLMTVPLGIISVIITLFLHQRPLSFMGLLGIVALAGVIVNNAIVLVDFINQRRRQGIGLHESIVEACRVRLRPIVLTSVTTALGILPTAYGIGGLDQFVVPIALALGWGSLVGSALTLLFFPAAVAVLDDLSKFISRRHNSA